jgi:hypothetical protein
VQKQIHNGSLQRNGLWWTTPAISSPACSMVAAWEACL